MVLTCLFTCLGLWLVDISQIIALWSIAVSMSITFEEKLRLIRLLLTKMRYRFTVYCFSDCQWATPDVIKPASSLCKHWLVAVLVGHATRFPWFCFENFFTWFRRGPREDQRFTPAELRMLKQGHWNKTWVTPGAKEGSVYDSLQSSARTKHLDLGLYIEGFTSWLVDFTTRSQ